MEALRKRLAGASLRGKNVFTPHVSRVDIELVGDDTAKRSQEETQDIDISVEKCVRAYKEDR